MTRARPAALVLGALAIAGCAREYAWPPPPAEVHFGEDDCAHCRMIVSDEHFAAQRRGRDGSVRIYDDLGCLLADGPSPEPEGVYVRAFDGTGWVRADRATIVQSADVRSPMGFGLAAFASPDGARAAATPHADGRVVPLATLLRDGAPPRAPLPIEGGSPPLGSIDSVPSSSQGESTP